MINIDSKNNVFELDGDGELLLVEFVEVALKLTELLSDKLEAPQKHILENLFKTVEFALNNKDN